MGAPDRPVASGGARPGVNAASLVEEQVTVLVAGEGRHLFETVEDPRLRITTSPAEAPPDLIVCPCGHDRRFEGYRSEPSLERLRALAANGPVGIVFDASTEGVGHKPDITASLHHLLGAVGIRCNAISAGPIKTLSASAVSDIDVMFKLYEKAAPLRRNVTQEEVGKSAIYLLSDLASGVTGEVLHVDAGYHIMGAPPPSAGLGSQ